MIGCIIGACTVVGTIPSLIAVLGFSVTFLSAIATLLRRIAGGTGRAAALGSRGDQPGSGRDTTLPTVLVTGAVIVFALYTYVGMAKLPR